MVEHLTTESFAEKVKNAKGTLMVDFFATWCGPCKMIAPILEEIAEEHPEYVIAKVNVDEEPELGREFKITSIPALFVIRDGEVTDKAVGYRNKEALLEMLEG